MREKESHFVLSVQCPVLEIVEEVPGLKFELRTRAALAAWSFFELFEAAKEVVVVRCFADDGVQQVDSIVVRGVVE